MGSNRERRELLWERRLRQARKCFLSFRQIVNPKMIWGWWQEEIAAELQAFTEDFQAGKRPMLVIQAPPQHGKSVQIIDFVAWLSGQNPDCRTIYTSFSERLGIRANLRLQRLYDSGIYREIFPNTRINTSNVVTISGQRLRNREILEYVEHEGFFRNTTVRGSITGESLDIGIIDDPIRGRADANSEAIREAAWEWFTNDFFTRFSEHAAFLAILTRWHVDDPIGRLIEHYPGLKVLSYPAIAEEDEPHRKAGEALFPEHKSLEFLMKRKAVMSSSDWLALYQQRPTVAGGNVIRGEWFGEVEVLPRITARAIFADTAQKTKEYNDYSVFLLAGLGDDGRLYLLDLLRGKWEAPDLERRAADFWAKHKDYDHKTSAPLRSMNIEDAASGTGLIQKIQRDARIPVTGVKVSKDKYTRLCDVLGYIESGYVRLPKNAPWVSDFKAECEAFSADDGHLHDDQVDALVMAISGMLAKDTNWNWVS
ncbi:MAG: phage terminase large subunit [Betaproteobacteria bacterium]|nr:phage terminase large subunit [Betaproteobacteria bacterium]